MERDAVLVCQQEQHFWKTEVVGERTEEEKQVKELVATKRKNTFHSSRRRRGREREVEADGQLHPAVPIRVNTRPTWRILEKGGCSARLQRGQRCWPICLLEHVRGHQVLCTNHNMSLG